MAPLARFRRVCLPAVLCTTLVLTASCSADEASSSEPDAGQSASASSDGSSGDSSADSAARSSGPPAPRTLTIAATGDVLPHAPVLASAQAEAGPGREYDFSAMLSQIEPILSAADLAFCHLETPLSADNTALTQPRTLSFASPRELAVALEGAGYDGCDFASNHTLDRGMEGLAQTQQVLADNDLGYAGPTADADRAGDPATYRVNGVEVAHLAYTYTLPNSAVPNTEVPPDARWLGRALWPLVGADGIVEDARRARADGAEVVVVSMHWGQEYTTEPTQQQTALARTLLDSSQVDLILGTHVHVPQPCASVNDRHVLYGMGNSLSNQSPDVDSRLRTETQEGMVAVVELTVGEDGVESSELSVQPTRVDLDGHIVEALGPQDFPDTTDRTMSTLTSYGSCKPSLLRPVR